MSIERKEDTNPEDQLTITETVATRAIESMMSNYDSPQQAFLELIDNAVDNREGGKPLAVRVTVRKNELSVFNQGGKGLDILGLRNFFVWGYSAKTAGDIGFYGVGGKSAMGYLGRSMEVVCSPKGSNEEYRIADPSWESRAEGEWKQYKVEKRKAVTPDGYFRVRVYNLKKEVNANALTAKLGDIYRPLLDGSVVIFLNGKEVEPLQIKYVENDPRFRPEAKKVQTRLGEWVTYKVGVAEEGQNLKPGIRCYYRGRLIDEGQFFGLAEPARLPQMQRFVGEAFLDFVPVTMNKNNFDKGSVEWESAVKTLFNYLARWEKVMAEIKIDQKHRLEAYERDLARQAKRLLEHILAESRLITKSELPEGEAIGRRFPTQTHPPRIPTGRPGGEGPKEGQTAPTLDATVSEMKRWGALFSWEVESFGSSGDIAYIMDDNGRRVLKINSDFPLYQKHKKDGEGSLATYLLEVGALKICELVSKDKGGEDLLQLYYPLLRRIGEINHTKPRPKEKSKFPKSGTINFN